MTNPHAKDIINPQARGIDSDTEVARTETRQLPVPRTEDQIIEAGRKGITLRLQAGAVRARAKELLADHKEQATALEVEARECDAIVRTGQAIDRVPCDVRRDFRLGEVIVVRTDTNQVIETRPMLADERQRTIPVVEAQAREVAETSALDVHERIHAALSRQPMTAGQLADALRLDADIIAAALDHGKAQNKYKGSKGRKWRLA